MNREVLSRRSAALVPSGPHHHSFSSRRGRGGIVTSVAGIRYDNRTALLAEVIIGSVVRLVRDYTNQYDPNAIEVRVGGGLLGYVPRTEGRLLAPRIDAGASTTATVVEVDRSQLAPLLRVEVSVETVFPRPSDRERWQPAAVTRRRRAGEFVAQYAWAHSPRLVPLSRAVGIAV